MALRIKSLRYQITSFFIITVFIALLLIVFFVAINHYYALKNELGARLSILSKAIITHKLNAAHTRYIPLQSLKDVEPYWQKTMQSFFSDLQLSLTPQKPLEDKYRMQVSTHLTSGDYLTVYSSFDAIQKQSISFALKTLLLFGAMFLFFGAFFFYFLRRTFAPIDCLVNYCKDLSSERETLPVCTGSLEINTLKDAILLLVDKNQKLILKERDIFKEAAHELKSPVAILKSRLALYEQKKSYAKEQFVHEAKKDIELIVNHLRDMLFLKSVEIDIESPKELIYVIDQCDELSNAFAPIVQKRVLTIQSDRDHAFSIFAHKKAIQKVLLAMFENIFIHAKINSAIHIVLDGDTKSIVVTNEICDAGGAKLFSSYIGTEIIQRLASKLDYEYFVSADGDQFVTTIRFIDAQSSYIDLGSNI